MNNKPFILFLGAALLTLLIGALLRDKTVDIQFYDTYFVIGIMQIATKICLTLCLTALIYYIFSVIKRPVNTRVGIWHFVLFVLAILAYCVAFIDLQSALGSTSLLVATVLFLIGQVVFIFGLTKAIMNGKR